MNEGRVCFLQGNWKSDYFLCVHDTVKTDIVINLFVAKGQMNRHKTAAGESANAAAHSELQRHNSRTFQTL